MRILRAALVVAAALALTACTAVATGTPSGSPTPSASTAPSSTTVPSPTPTPTAATAAALVLSLDAIDAVDSAGNTITSATLADGAAVEALVTGVLGAPNERTQPDDKFNAYVIRWDGISIGLQTGRPDASVHVQAATSAGIALRSAAGVSVGMTRDQAIAAGLTAESSFTDADNKLHERLVSENRPTTKAPSLTHPGEPGNDFVGYEVVDGIISWIYAPGNDYADI